MTSSETAIWSPASLRLASPATLQVGCRAPEVPSRVTSGSVLFVCTANVTRSAFMHLTFASLLQAEGFEGIEVGSAGVQAAVGSGPHPRVRAWLEAWGVPHDAFAARQVQAADIATSELVLTASRRQRDLVVRMAPASSTKTFTLLQLHRLLGDASGQSPLLCPLGATPTTYVARLAASRRGLGGGASEADDLADPTGERGAAFAAMFKQVHPVLHNLVAHLKAHQQHSMGEEQA